MIFYGNIQIPRISGNFDACADSVYQALFPRKKGSLGSRLTYHKLGTHIELCRLFLAQPAAGARRVPISPFPDPIVHVRIWDLGRILSVITWTKC